MCRDRRERSAYHSTVTATLRNTKLAGSSSHAFPSSSAACAGLRSPSWRLTAGSLPGPRVYSNPPSVLSTTKTLFVTAATLDARRIQRIRNSLDARCTAAAPVSRAAISSQPSTQSQQRMRFTPRKACAIVPGRPARCTSARAARWPEVSERGIGADGLNGRERQPARLARSTDTPLGSQQTACQPGKHAESQYPCKN